MPSSILYLKAKIVEEKPEYFDREYCKAEISKVIPKTIKQVKPKLRETIYALRYRIEEGKKCYYFVSRFYSSVENFRLLEGEKKTDKCAKKNVKKIFDLKIQKDFQNELNKEGLTQEKWEKFLNEYTVERKRIKKISMIDSKCFDESEVFNPDATLKEVIGEYGHKGAMKGQWIKGKESHQGQIVYKDEKEKWKVVPVYVFESIYNKCREYKNKYINIRFFKSGQLVELKKDYNDIKSGIYTLRTLRSDGWCELENINDQSKIGQSIGTFIEQCGMEVYKKQ